MKKKAIAIVAGGTAGHIFPAQALSEILGTKNQIMFFTDARGSRYFEDKGKIEMLWISNLTGNIVKKGLALLKLSIATLRCIFLLKKEKVKLAIGFGGITSFPVLFAAKILKIPIIIHEQNAVLGKANKFFLKDAKLVATSYERTIGADNIDVVVNTGNPIRKIVFNARRRRTRITKEIHILVIGGSQGAKIMDQVVAEALTKLPDEVQENISIWQQVRDIDHVKGIYKNSRIRRFYVENFFQDLPQIMADSDLVISRGGASALSEIEHLRIPSIVIPMATSADNHQYHNASEYVKKGIGIMIEEKDLSVEFLLSKLLDLFVHGQLERLCNAARDCAENKSAQKLAIKINEIIINLRL